MHCIDAQADETMKNEDSVPQTESRTWTGQAIKMNESKLPQIRQDMTSWKPDRK